MMNEIFVNEIMNINELENVSGGTNRECKELKAALPQVAGLFGMRNMRESDVVAWLNDCLGIKATLHDGFLLDPRDNAGSPNLYKLKSTGKYISHEETMGMIQNLLKKA